VNIVIITVVKSDLIGLRRTEESLKSQNEQFKWIIVTPKDQSETFKYIEKLQEKNLVDRVFYDSGLGIYNAMNIPLPKLEDSDWVWYLNSGDEIAFPDTLRFIKRIIGNTNKKWVYGGHLLASNPNKILGEVPAPVHFNVRNQLFALSYVSHQSVLVEAGLLKKVGGFNENYKIAADWDLLVRISQHDSGERISQPLAVFYLGGSSSTNKQIGNLELLKIRSNHLDLRYTLPSVLWFLYRFFRNNFIDVVVRWFPDLIDKARSLRLKIKNFKRRDLY
jgi:hypothetical protein